MDNCGRLEPVHQLLKEKARGFKYYLQATQVTVTSHLGEDRIEEVWFLWWRNATEILEDWVASSMFAFNIMDKCLRSPEEFQTFVGQSSIAEVSQKVDQALMKLRLVFDCVWLFEGGNLRSFYSVDVVRVAEFLVNVYDGRSDGPSESSDDPLSDLDSDD